MTLIFLRKYGSCFVRNITCKTLGYLITCYISNIQEILEISFLQVILFVPGSVCMLYLTVTIRYPLQVGKRYNHPAICLALWPPPRFLPNCSAPKLFLNDHDDTTMSGYLPKHYQYILILSKLIDMSQCAMRPC